MTCGPGCGRKIFRTGAVVEMHTAWTIIRKAAEKLDHLLFSFLLRGMSPQAISAITGDHDRRSRDFGRKATWRQFQEAAQGKRLILLGLDGVAPGFIARYQKQFDIACVYAFSGARKVESYRGIPVKDMDTFHKDIYGGNNVYLIASSYSVSEYAAYLEGQGITDYFCYLAMESRRWPYRLRRPLVRFRYRFLYQAFHRDGLFTNYVLFPIAALLRKLHVPGFYPKVRNIRSVKDRHAGERCFIIATGPSLWVEDVELLRDEITFSVNGIFKLYGQTTWRPTYYALCDPYVYLDYLKKGYPMDLDELSEREAFLPLRLEKALRGNAHRKKTVLVPVCYLNHMLSDKKTRLHYSDDPVWGFYNLRTVACFCANLAQYMGFREIYLLGTDCDYITNGQHFSDEKSPNLLEYDQLRKAQDLLITAFSFLEQEMGRRGIAVFNATRGGALEVFPRVALEDVLGVAPVRAGHEDPQEDAAADGGQAGAAPPEPDTPEPAEDAAHLEDTDIDVSVIMLTYDHERYVGQALDSILSQKTSYRYEILVGDDASRDDTAEILKRYAQEHPDVIRLFLHRENVGASRNAWELFKNARGRYIANLEGDDYWTSTEKLEKQIRFLEESPEYIGCTHACRWVNQFGKALMSIAVNNGQRCTGDYTIDDLKDGMWQLPGQTGALVYRNIYPDCPKLAQEMILLDRMQCDRSIALLLASYGPIRCFPEVMSHYRHVVDGTASHSTRYKHDIRRKQEMIRYLQKLEGYTEPLLGEAVEFGARKRRIFVDAIQHCWPDISEDEKLVLDQMMRESGDEGQYRELYSATQDRLRLQAERTTVERFKRTVSGMVLYLPRALKRAFKRVRDRWFSPVLEASKQEAARSRSLARQIDRTDRRVAYLETMLEQQAQQLAGLTCGPADTEDDGMGGCDG